MHFQHAHAFLHQAQITDNSFNSYDNYINTQQKDFAEALTVLLSVE